jgi:acetyl esterase/lipase
LKTNSLALILIIVVSAILASLVGFYFVTGGSFFASTGTNNTTTVLDGVKIQNVAYCNIGGDSEQMDIYLPTSVSNGTLKAASTVIYVHGGGWVYGDKSDNWQGIFPMFLASNFVVVSINYFMPQTTVPPYGFPTNVEDVACAVRFLRANANQYHIDPQHIGLLGTSAGGNLASLEAVSALNGTFDSVGQYTSFSSQVEAVVDGFGPANLTDPIFSSESLLRDYGPAHYNLLEDVFANSSKNMIQASPADYVVSSKAPPFLIMQGENDTTVPMSQSVEFYNSLRAQGDNAQLVLVQNCGHDFAQINPNIPINPSLSTLLSDIVSFFKANLQGTT